jgi:adenylate cyclase
VVAIDCGLSEEDVQQPGSIFLLGAPDNLIFPVHAAGAQPNERIIEASSFKASCIEYDTDRNIRYGHTLYFIDRDGIARKVPVQVKAGSNVERALSYESVELYHRSLLQINEVGDRPFLIVSNRLIPLEYGGTFRPNFYPRNRFTILSFSDILEWDEIRLEKTFKGKLVLAGVNLPGWGVRYLYPLSKQNLSSSVVIQANVINSLLTGEVFSTQPQHFIGVMLVIINFILAILFVRTKVSISAFIALLAVIAWFAFAFYLYLNFYLIDTMVIPISMLFTFAFVHAILHAEEAREKRLVENIFGRYLKPELVEEIVKNPHTALESLKGTTREATVLFADIRGFTGFCEKRSPVEVVNVLNDVFERATEAIFSEDGMIDKFIGDGIMVLFNIPYDQSDHPDRAVRSALKIMKAIREMDLGLAFGIGINTGEVVAGNIGSSKRMEYTAIGDTVNTASRLAL